MKSFSDDFIKKLHISSDVISQIAALAEFKGKEELYQKQSPDILHSMMESAMIESAESSNRIEGIVVPHDRVEAIVHKSTPRNRSEEEVAGYRDALARIHEMYEGMGLSCNVILMLHSMLYKHTTVKAGEWKRGDNQIVERTSDGKVKVRFEPVPALKTPEYMEELVQFYHYQDEQEHTEALISIPLFILDFLCVHPFKDGNGRVGRLLTLLLLYQAGFKVGKYIGLERIIEDSKETYYEALYASSQKWHEGKHDVLPWLKYFYGVLTAAYKEFESRVGVFDAKKTKSERIINKIGEFSQPFSVSMIKEVCEDVSIDLIRKILKDLQKAGKIKPLTKGRYAKWLAVKK